MSETPKTLTVAYWKIRGLCAPLRMLVYFAGVQDTVNFVCYDAGDPEAVSYKSEWLAAKPALLERHAMINLPYCIDSEQNHIITQSNACLYFLGRRFQLDGNTEPQKQRIDQVIAQTMDLRNAAVGQFYRSTRTVPEYITQVVTSHYTKLNEFMTENKTNFSAADEVTVADFHLWEMLDQHEEYFKRHNTGSSEEITSILPQFPRLAALYSAIRQHEALQSYFASPLYKLPLNNPHANFR